MNTDNRRPARRAMAGVLAGVLALSGAAVAAGVSPANAAPTFDLVRVEGADRYATSAAILDRFGASTGAILASGESGRYADALSANFLAGVRGVPVALTQREAIPLVILAALKRAGVREVTIIGGADVISEAQERALRSEQFSVTRLGGADRFATSQRVIAAGQTAASPVGLVATGLDFADALGAGPLSYRGKHPMFLVRPASVPAETLAAMRAAGTRSVILIGGESVVGPAVVEVLRTAGITVVTRLAGADRSATSARVAEYLLGNGYDNTAFNLASGQNGGVDALGGAALSGKQNRALLISNAEDNPGQVTAFAFSNRATLSGTGLVFGGPAAVSTRAMTAVETAGRTTASNQTFSFVTGADSTFLAGGGVRQYSVEVGSASSVDVQLFACSNVTTSANGTVTFAGTNPGGSGNAAVVQDVRSTVSAVNGVAGASADQVVPANGIVTFSVTANVGDACVVPVVFIDTGDIDRLPLDASGAPTAAFGIAGRVTVGATEAVSGTFSAASVTRIDAANDFFQLGTGAQARSFRYVMSRDVFQLASGSTSTTVTAAEFERRLSVGDTVSGLYNATQGSTFTLTDAAPVAPATVATRTPQGANAGKAGLEVTFDRSSTATVASYDVLRAIAVESSVIGQSATCPSEGSFAVVGSVARVGDQASYAFFDATATPPASGTTTPQYCYAVRAVDVAGDTSALSAVAGPATAASAASTTVTPMAFIADGTAVTGPSTIRVRFNNPVNPATVSSNGGDFRVTSTEGSIATNLAVASAAPGSVSTDVVLTLFSALSGPGEITVTSQAGSDGNTVCAGTATTNCQPTGQVVLVARDVTAPTMVSATAALNGTENDTVTVTYSEAVLPFGGAYTNTQFIYEPTCGSTTGRVLGVVTQAGDNGVTVVMATNTLPSADDADDCVRYLDGDPTSADDGDVTDIVGNPQASPSTVAVPAATS